MRGHGLIRSAVLTHAEGRAQLAEESADEAGGEGAWPMTSRSAQRKANEEDKQSSPTNPEGTEEKGTAAEGVRSRQRDHQQTTSEGVASQMV